MKNNKPYKILFEYENVQVRMFPKECTVEDLHWHTDEHDRQITHISGKGWFFQKENCLPTIMRVGAFVKRGTIHRLLNKGREEDLIIAIVDFKD